MVFKQTVVYAECRQAECRYAECRGAAPKTQRNTGKEKKFDNLDDPGPSSFRQPVSAISSIQTTSNETIDI